MADKPSDTDHDASQTPNEAGASITRGRSGKTARERLDVLLVHRGLAPTRERARALILAGQVLVDGRVVDKAGMPIPESAHVELAGPAEELRYVSRGGLKLEHALDAFGLDPAGCVCLDAGASTGGFTDVLLRRGAKRVYAVDVGHGQLAWSLRSDPRVVVMERTNIRTLETLPEPVDCAVIDVSFISLRLVLPRVSALLRPGAWIVALVKPQFEAGKAEADRGAGVIVDRSVHVRVLHELLDWLAQWDAHSPAEQRLVPRGLVVSPIAGREGNREYLLELVVGTHETGEEQSGDAATNLPSAADTGETRLAPTVDAAIQAAVTAAFAPSAGDDTSGAGEQGRAKRHNHRV